MDAAPVKSFLAFFRSGTLSTQSAKHPGFPFGSLVEHDLDPGGRPIIFISRLAEHFRNLEADPRASLFVSDVFGIRDPQAFARATVLATFTQVPDEERDAVAERYFERFPSSPGRALVHDFLFYRGEVERIRWIGGFGDIRWISAADYTAATFDEVSYRGAEAVEHMNEDHVDALEDYVRAHETRKDTSEVTRKPGVRPRMVAIDTQGFVVLNGSRPIRIAFPTPLTSPTEVRSALITELKRCRALLPPKS